MANKYISPSRRVTPWTDTSNCTPMQYFIDRQVQNLYIERHGKLEKSLEVAMFNSVEITSCRHCKSEKIKRNGFTSNKVKRYKCGDCNRTFTPVTGTLFNNHKLAIEEWIDFCLQLFSDQSFLSISKSNRNSYSTTRYWVAKLALALEDIQNNIKLSGDVYIDETFISVVRSKRTFDLYGRKLRGLSRDQYCIAIACDKSNTVCKLLGMGKPSMTSVYNALKAHIKPGSHIIHDGEKAHTRLISELGLLSTVHKSADTKGLDDKNNPLDPINDKCASFKRFIRAHSGFNRDYLDQMLNLFVFIINPPQNPYQKIETALTRMLNIPNSLTFRDLFCK